MEGSVFRLFITVEFSAAYMSRTSLILSFLALFLLRFVIGFHFFSEGTTKIRSGNFDASYFLLAAKGPLASHYHQLVDDHDGSIRLCRYPHDDRHLPGKSDGYASEYAPKSALLPDRSQINVDTRLTFDYWRHFLNEANEKYQFGSEDVTRELEQKCALLAQQIREAEQISNDNENTESDLIAMRLQYESLLADVKGMRTQRKDANAIIDRYESNLSDYLAANGEEIIAYFRGEDRLDGFAQDGPNRKSTAFGVESLYKQVGSIQSERTKKAAGWMTDVENLWEGYEREINELANDVQKKDGEVRLYRPYDPPNSKLSLINQYLPWFDVVIGCLLMVGLFSRIASLLGAGFLASVIASQPPWILDAQPVFYQAIEMFGLLVIFATAAGRFAGIDFFIHSMFKRLFNENNSE